MATTPPYQEWINSLIGTGYANLKFLDDMVMKPDHDDATCKILTFSDNGAAENLRAVRDADFEKAKVGKSKRLFILQGISRTYVEKLGSTLDIEPEFFAFHLRSTTWEHFDDRSDAAMLPSIRKQTRFWTLDYLECIQLQGKFERHRRTKLVPYPPILRRMFIRNPSMDRRKYNSVGLVSRMISYWEHPVGNGNFDAVLLVDTPLKPQLKFVFDDVVPNEERTTTWQPYGGGFVDFANIDKRKLFIQRSPPYPESRNGSITDSLLWRLDNAEIFTSAQDGAIGVILQRLALSQWMLTLAFLRRDFYSIRIQRLTRDSMTQVQVKYTLADLESCHELLDRCSYLVRKNLIQLGIAPDQSNSTVPSGSSDAALLKTDWAFVWQELRHWIGETDRLLNLRLANLSVLDSKRSRDDSERAAWMSESSNQITKLGQILLLVFTPAAFAYGILSMGEDFSPGKRQFWVFFAIAVPLSMVTVVAFYAWVWWSARERERRIEGWQEQARREKLDNHV